jgi:3-hydroxyacyl-CoA dehydrogenase
VKKLVADPGKAGQLAWKVISRSLAYAARRMGEIADSVVAIDEAMRWGYNWDLGPFETWDALGFADTVARMEKDGLALPASIKAMVASGATSFYKGGQVFDLLQGKYVDNPKDSRTATLPMLRRGDKPVLSNDGAEAWDLGDGVLGLTFKTKANSLDADVITMLGKAVEKAESDFRAMIIANQGEFFCVGANLFLVAMAGTQKDTNALRTVVKTLQDTVQRVRYASVPTVAAPYGMTLGGGLELCFACTAVQAAAETYAGLVEVGVGLLPGGGGNMNMLWRALEGVPEGTNVIPFEFVAQVFKNIALAKVATSADEAKQLGFFRKTDGVSFDRARQLVEAKAKAIGLAETGYHAPVPRAYRLPGEAGIATLQSSIETMVAGGFASEHDALIAGKVATVLCGGPAGASHEVTEEEMLALEREAFVELACEPKSLERMQYMLMNNKPLRN